jgi:CRISPR-associated protein Csb1
MSTFTLSELKQAVSGDIAAIRRITKLSAAGGSGDKLFPPTYLSKDDKSEYATEERKVASADGVVRPISTVLLDSVQSQANRLEMALLRGYKAGKLRFPLALVDFAKDDVRPVFRDIGQITTLEAPHRFADAIFRDSRIPETNQLFRESDFGKKLDEARTTNATPLFETCPTALVFGIWDSTGPRGGLGAKFQRALVSEIVGYDVQTGVRASSRIDPLQIEREGVVVYAKQGGGWTTDENMAVSKDGKDKVKFGKEGKPSELNHGNIPPSLFDKKKNPNLGGVTVAYAVQTTVLSLAALRRLSFPINGGVNPNQTAIDEAAQMVLAALGLAAICQLDRDGYDLRSRCLLDGKPGTFELVGQGEARPFSLDAASSAELLNQAVAEAVRLGLPWPLEPRVLAPSEELKKLILKSREKTAAATAE